MGEECKKSVNIYVHTLGLFRLILSAYELEHIEFIRILHSVVNQHVLKIYAVLIQYAV